MLADLARNRRADPWLAHAGPDALVLACDEFSHRLRMDMRRTIFLLLALLCVNSPVAGAADTIPSSERAQRRLYRDAGACCTDPAQFEFLATTLPGQSTFDIGPTSRLFEFQSGRSYFAALRLPASTSSYRVRVKSLLQGRGDATRVFYPVVALLNDNFIVTRVSSMGHLRLEPALATPNGASGLSLTVRVDPAIAAERYLVVFTPAILLGEPPQERREGDVLTDSATEFFERKGEAAIAPAIFGRLQVSLLPDSAETPRDVADD